MGGVWPLCERCHQVKHWGNTEIEAQKGQVRMEDLVNHYLRINRVDRTAFEADLREARERWLERSTHVWTIDWSLLIRRFGVDVARYDGATLRYVGR